MAGQWTSDIQCPLQTVSTACVCERPCSASRVLSTPEVVLIQRLAAVVAPEHRMALNLVVLRLLVVLLQSASRTLESSLHIDLDMRAEGLTVGLQTYALHLHACMLRVLTCVAVSPALSAGRSRVRRGLVSDQSTNSSMPPEYFQLSSTDRMTRRPYRRASTSTKSSALNTCTERWAT